MSPHDNLRGAAWMTTGMAGYVVNDALMKWATEEVPLFQAIVMRGLVIVALLLGLVRARGTAEPFATYMSRPLVVRMGMEAIGTVLYLSALTRLPLANLTAILQLVPIAVTFVAARLLHERLNPVRVAALLAGFAGVLLVVRPGSADFSIWYLVGGATVIVIIVRELATRRIPTEVSGLAIALGTAVTITLIGAVVSVFEGWEAPAGPRIAALVTAAAFLSVGYVSSVNAVRVGEIGFTAPFRYTILLFAIVLQIAIFRETPDAMTLAGAAIITLAGLAALRTGTATATPAGLRVPGSLTRRR